MITRLVQFQCQKEGSIFYYQHGLRRIDFINHCPVCGSKRVEPTGREFAAVNEMAPIPGAR